MQYVTVYNFDSKTRKSIPLAELSPNMVKGQLPDGSVVWVDNTKLKLTSTPLHPPFSESKRQILRQLVKDLGEVDSNTLAQWEAQLRSDIHADREIRTWRWIAFQYKRLTRARQASQARKRDYYQLLVRWTFTKKVDVTLATVNLGELSRLEARLVLESLSTTPSEFFGGFIAETFPGVSVIDHAAIHSLDEFKTYVANASVILAVDWNSGDNFNVVFGGELMKSHVSSNQPLRCPMVVIAIDFDSDQVERLCAMVEIVKGRHEWKQGSPSDPTGTGETREQP